MRDEKMIHKAVRLMAYHRKANVLAKLQAQFTIL
jgi:hypothetical protein